MSERQVQVVLLAAGATQDGGAVTLPNPAEMRHEFDEALVAPFVIERAKPELDRWRRAVGLSA